MKPSPLFLTITKSQRRGIVWTMVLFFVLHLGMTFYPKLNQNTPNTLMLDSMTQQKVDSLIVIKSAVKKDTIYPFNPNYISDFKAYQLDIPIEAVNRIRAFRTAGKFINSIEVFKEVTMLSDDEMTRIRPYLKLPKPKFTIPKPKKVTFQKKEINGASLAELQQVYGIGEVYANRIIDLRNKLGGFLLKDQLGDVWGLTPETQQRIWKHFNLDSVPHIEKKNINDLTIAKLSKLYYVSPSLASRIVAIRTQKETLTSWNDLESIQQLDSLKKARLSLYLSFK